MKQYLLTVLLCACLFVGLSGAAQAQEKDITAQRLEDIDFLYNTLQERHPNMFSVNPQRVFTAKMSQLAGQAGSYDDFSFALALQSLAALVGDSHTAVSLSVRDDNLHFYPFTMEYYDGQWVLDLADKDKAELVGQTITAINGFTLDQAVEMMMPIISHDNEIKLRRQFKQLIYIAEVLEYCGLAVPGQPLTLTLTNTESQQQQELVLPALLMAESESVGADYIGLSELRKQIPPTEWKRDAYYFAQPLGESAYYIQYNRCLEDENLPMEKFYGQVEADFQAGAYDKILVDMRYNGGGSDGLLVPILILLNDMAREADIKLFCLIDEATFSSATINALMMKDMGAILVGAPTSGSADHFGSVSRFTLPHSGLNVSHSTKMIDIADYLECGHGYGIEPITPDYAVPQTLADYAAGIDTAVQYILEQGSRLENPPINYTVLTRGAFINQLWQKAQEVGLGTESGEAPFGDVFPFAPHTPAINWAYAAGLIKGIDENRFAPAHPLTGEQMEILLARFSAYAGEELTF